MRNAVMVLMLLFGLPGWIRARQPAKILTHLRTAPPIRGAVRLQDGTLVRFSYYFDHNALMDCVRAKESLVCLTESGNLLRFDEKTLSMNGQTIMPGRATTITVICPDRVLVGTQRGEIFEVDTATLALKHIATADGKVVWLSGRESVDNCNAAIVAVVDNSPQVASWPGELWKVYDNNSALLEAKEEHPYYVRVYFDGRERSLPFQRGKHQAFPTAYLLDDFNRLWMGTDAGEWGGECSYMDLHTGKVRVVSREVSGVLGFICPRDGSLLAYGGTSHLGMEEGYIARVTPEGMQLLSRFENDWNELRPSKGENAKATGRGPQAASPKNTPQGPVDLMVGDEAGGGFWVVSAHILYRTDSNFHHWTKIADLGGRWYGGRRYSMGSTPTINRLMVEISKTENQLAVMGRDGLERVTAGKVERVSFEGQLESSVVDIWKTSMGTLLLNDDSVHVAWRLADERWQSLSFFPDRHPLLEGTYWGYAQPFADHGSGILAFVGNSLVPGERDIVRLKSGSPAEVIATWEDRSDDLDASFLLSREGDLLMMAEGKVWARQASGWRLAGHSRLSDGVKQTSEPYGRRYLPLEGQGPAEFFLDAEFGEFLRLARAPDNSYEFAPAVYPKNTLPRGVFDATADRDGWFLVATAQGLVRFRPDDGERELIPGSFPGGQVRSLCRDGDGRLWAAGDALFVSSDEGKSWELLNLPMFTKTYAKKVRPNPQDPRGLILALYDQGVVFVDW